MRKLEDENRGLSHHRGGVTRLHGARDAIRRRDRARRPTRGHARRTSYGRRHRCHAILQARHQRPHVEALRRALVSASEPFFKGEQLAMGQSQLGLRRPHRCQAT